MLKDKYNQRSKNLYIKHDKITMQEVKEDK